MNEMDQFKQTYFTECEELLADLEEHLLTLEEDGSDVEALHAVFRAIHSIKGGAGAFGFDRLVTFAHTFETTLDLMREGALDTTPENVELAVKASDILSDLVQAAQNDEDLEDNYEVEIGNELAKLSGGEVLPPVADGEDDFDDDFDLDFTPVAVGEAAAAQAEAPAAADGDEAPMRTYSISFVPHANMLARANEPLLILRELKELGTVIAKGDASNVPGLDALEPEDAYISWTIEVITSAPREAIDEAFEFVVDDCDLTISVDQEPEAEPAPAPVVEEPPAPQATATLRKEPVEEPAPKADAPKPNAKEKPKGGDKKTAAAGKASSVRVDLDKMDRMVNMVGELVITQAMLVQQGEKYPDMVRGLESLTQHTRELQDSVMAMRAQPVKSVFSRMPRLVRELSSITNKKINLVMTGENTEIDKTVIEQLGDPLTHMIRNAADHGLESPEERVQLGKPEEGTIHLSAEHRGGRIVIEIMDDGRGINRDKVMQKAIEKGMVQPNATLTEEEIDNLILLPGFSTAEQVSNLSGRGVGMDVVLRNIQNLGGRVGMRSSPGKGSVFTMTLPLTLAVLDGMIVGCGHQTFVLPLANIIESLRPHPNDVNIMAGDPNKVVLSIRGEYIQLIYLHRRLKIPDAIHDPSKGLVVVVETEGGNKVGIVVDEILGQQQVVIKSLEDNYHPIDGIAAATILGDGKVALILDVAGLMGMSSFAPAASADQPQQQGAVG